MKKIIALLTLFVMTFTSGYATTGENINLTSDDVLYANIFYIDGIGYLKENNKLKEIKGIEFYSIAGQRYIKKEGKILKVKENKIFKINDINYVNTNGILVTLDKYLSANPIKDEINKKLTFSEIFKKKINKDLKLSYLSENKINKIKNKVLMEVIDLILEDNEKNYNTVILLAKGKFTTEQLSKMKEYYYNKGNIKISKKIFILENISKINVVKVNSAIKAKLNKSTINFVKKNTQEINDNLSIEGLFKEMGLDLIDKKIINTKKNGNNKETTTIKTSKENSETIKIINKTNIEADTTITEEDDDEMIQFFKAMGLDTSDL